LEEESVREMEEVGFEFSDIANSLKEPSELKHLEKLRRKSCTW